MGNKNWDNLIKDQFTVYYKFISRNIRKIIIMDIFQNLVHISSFPNSKFFLAEWYKTSNQRIC